VSLVTFNDVHLAYGSQVVLDGLELVIHPGEHVGLVGPNGCGKTTLLKLITGELRPEMGSIIRNKNLKIGYLPQEPEFGPTHTVMEEMHSGFEDILRMQRRLDTLSASMAHLHDDELAGAMKDYDRLHAEFELAGGYDYEVRIRTILAGVGLPEELFNSETGTLSGGQKSRLGLAKVLAAEAELLLLDEPTNHLDLQATEWLERFLQNFAGAAVIISHDRYLLDNVVCKIIEMERRKAKVWKGNYSNYAQTKETVTLEQERQYQARKLMVEKTLDFIARNKDQEGMRGTARGRKTRLTKLLKNNPDFLDRPDAQKRINFSFGKVEAKGDIAIACESVKMGFGELTLFDNLSFELEPGERLGITGPNGTGKSTLIKLIMAKIAPLAGRIKVAPSAAVGYLDQAGAELDPEKTALEEVGTVRPDMLHGELRNRLGAFLFSGDDVFKKVADLSGGEKNRLVLCKLVLSSPGILLLDEPTNHLDIASKETLEAALSDYAGTLVVVSHDRFFLDRVVDRLLVIGVDEVGKKDLGNWQLVEGAYTEYSRLVTERGERRELEAAAAANAAPKSRPGKPDSARRTTPAELRKFSKLTIDELEKAIMEAEQERQQLLDRFGDQDVYKDGRKAAEVQAAVKTKEADIDLLYRAYEWRTEKQGQ
jgi:ATP-binding cassette, subfamily F, member 3